MYQQVIILHQYIHNVLFNSYLHVLSRLLLVLCARSLFFNFNIKPNNHCIKAKFNIPNRTMITGIVFFSKYNISHGFSISQRFNQRPIKIFYLFLFIILAGMYIQYTQNIKKPAT